MLPRYPLTAPAVLAFVVIPIVLIGVFVWGVAAAWRRAGASSREAATVAVAVLVGSLAWLAATWVFAARGVFFDFDRRPPAFAMLFVAIVALAIAIARGRIGTRLAALPLWVLVGVQGFRLPLELAMHALADRGIMPEQMSYTGLNFDVMTGATAPVVALLVATGRGGRRLVFWWNVGGLVLLVNIVAIAIASTPAFAAFGSDRLNTFVFHPPFVWLPAVMVLAALAGHLLIWRAIARRPG